MDYYVGIREKCMQFYQEKVPGTVWDWAMECMDLEGLPMHCPPHHFMIPAVLLTACAAKDGKSEEELAKMLTEAKSVPKKSLAVFAVITEAAAPGWVLEFFSVFIQTLRLFRKKVGSG